MGVNVFRRLNPSYPSSTHLLPYLVLLRGLTQPHGVVLDGLFVGWNGVGRGLTVLQDAHA